MIYKLGIVITKAEFTWMTAHETEEACVGACTEGDDLFLLVRIVINELFDKVIDGFGADIGPLHQ